MKKRNLFTFLLYLSILIFVFWLLLSIFGSRGNEIAYSDVIKLFQNQ